MLAHKDSRVFSTVTQISSVGFLSPDDGKLKNIKVKTHILGDNFEIHFVHHSEVEPALTQDMSKAVHQADRVTVTRTSETVENAGQLSSCPTSSRNFGIGVTAVQDAEKAGVSVSTHHPQ